MGPKGTQSVSGGHIWAGYCEFERTRRFYGSPGISRSGIAAWPAARGSTSSLNCQMRILVSTYPWVCSSS